MQCFGGAESRSWDLLYQGTFIGGIAALQGYPSRFLLSKANFTAPVLIYHGLNGVYLSDYKKWIRLDARGNKTGVRAEFSTQKEQLAFTVRPELGEADGFIIYPDPDIKIVENLRKSKTRTALWQNLPTELGYNTQL